MRMLRFIASAGTDTVIAGREAALPVQDIKHIASYMNDTRIIMKDGTSYWAKESLQELVDQIESDERFAFSIRSNPGDFEEMGRKLQRFIDEGKEDMKYLRETRKCNPGDCMPQG